MKRNKHLMCMVHFARIKHISRIKCLICFEILETLKSQYVLNNRLRDPLRFF